ncbi:MAG TPA: DUF2141 domain-containing protein [Xanthomarina sp.]|nr:DUF2141 domain-containing protein [Xanthomarina sp.]
MKTLALIFSFFFITPVPETLDIVNTYSITVTINNPLSDNGTMIIGLHNESTFMKSQGIENQKSVIIDGKVQVTFEDLKPGTYAIMVLHDANGNGRMDFNDNGMPLESYGMSNNPMLYGPPSFTDAKFNLENEDLELQIRL